MVMVYLRREVLAGADNELKSKKFESFKIVKKISDNAYVVDLPSDMAISGHSMWQISMNITLPSSYIHIITQERVLLKREGLM